MTHQHSSELLNTYRTSSLCYYKSNNLVPCFLLVCIPCLLYASPSGFTACPWIAWEFNTTHSNPMPVKLQIALSKHQIVWSVESNFTRFIHRSCQLRVSWIARNSTPRTTVTLFKGFSPMVARPRQYGTVAIVAMAHTQSPSSQAVQNVDTEGMELARFRHPDDVGLSLPVHFTRSNKDVDYYPGYSRPDFVGHRASYELPSTLSTRLLYVVPLIVIHPIALEHDYLDFGFLLADYQVSHSLHFLCTGSPAQRCSPASLTGSERYICCR